MFHGPSCTLLVFGQYWAPGPWCVPGFLPQEGSVPLLGKVHPFRQLSLAGQAD